VLKKKMKCAEGRKYPGEHSQELEKQQHSYHYVYQVGRLTSAREFAPPPASSKALSLVDTRS